MSNPRDTQHAINELHHWGAELTTWFDDITDSTLHGWFYPVNTLGTKIWLAPAEEPRAAVQALYTLQMFLSKRQLP